MQINKLYEKRLKSFVLNLNEFKFICYQVDKKKVFVLKCYLVEKDKNIVTLIISLLINLKHL